MKFLYLSIAVFPSWAEARRKMWVWFRSAERFQHDFHYYGVATKQFPGYRAMKIECQLEWLDSCYAWIYSNHYTHIFYTDSADCLMLAPPEEIEAKYTEMGCPPVLWSAYHQLGNVSDPARYPLFDSPEWVDKYGSYRYPNGGGYIMEVPLLLDYLRQATLTDTGDDCFILYDRFQSGWDATIDSNCAIWQVRGTENCDVVERDGRVRLHNRVTGEYPCVIHESGGYTDQQTLKDHTMIPLARRLGIIGETEERP
jgi:hypothetical protein